MTYTLTPYLAKASELGRFLGTFQMHDGKLVFPAFVVED